MVIGRWCLWSLALLLLASTRAAERTLYEYLGVRPTATEKEIRKAYHQLSLKYHPDKNKAEGAKDRFLRINEAYETLSNPENRRRYDLGYRGGQQQGRGSFHHGHQWHQHHQHHQRGERHFRFYDNNGRYYEFRGNPFHAHGGRGGGSFYGAQRPNGGYRGGGSQSLFEYLMSASLPEVIFGALQFCVMLAFAAPLFGFLFEALNDGDDGGGEDDEGEGGGNGAAQYPRAGSRGRPGDTQGALTPLLPPLGRKLSSGMHSVVWVVGGASEKETPVHWSELSALRRRHEPDPLFLAYLDEKRNRDHGLWISRLRGADFFEGEEGSLSPLCIPTHNSPNVAAPSFLFFSFLVSVFSVPLAPFFLVTTV